MIYSLPSTHKHLVHYGYPGFTDITRKRYYMLNEVALKVLDWRFWQTEYKWGMMLTLSNTAHHYTVWVTSNMSMTLIAYGNPISWAFVLLTLIIRLMPLRICSTSQLYTPDGVVDDAYDIWCYAFYLWFLSGMTHPIMFISGIYNLLLELLLLLLWYLLFLL